MWKGWSMVSRGEWILKCCICHRDVTEKQSEDEGLDQTVDAAFSQHSKLPWDLCHHLDLHRKCEMGLQQEGCVNIFVTNRETPLFESRSLDGFESTNWTLFTFWVPSLKRLEQDAQGSDGDIIPRGILKDLEEVLRNLHRLALHPFSSC